MSYQNNTFRQDPIYYQNGMAKFGVANMSDLISDLQRELDEEHRHQNDLERRARSINEIGCQEIILYLNLVPSREI